MGLSAPPDGLGCCAGAMEAGAGFGSKPAYPSPPWHNVKMGRL